MSYLFDGLWAIDPLNPSNVAVESEVTIFDPNDPAMAPVALEDPSGMPLENPLLTNDKGFVGAFRSDLKKIGWTAGGLSGYVGNFESVALAAETSALDAASAASDAEEAKLAAMRASQMVGAPADNVVANLLTTDGTDSQVAADGRYSKRGEIVVSVHDYGAVGDGYTNDDLAVQTAANVLRDAGGGVLKYRPGYSYKLDGAVELSTNTLVDQLGATIVKRGPVSSYSAYVTRSHGAHGYGSGGKNIRVVGGIMRGQFASNVTGIAITFHHAEDIEFDSVIFTESVISGHAIDLGGCKNVRIARCIFEGWKVTTDREYTEAIQLDYSTAQSMGTETAPNAYDGLPTVDVVVEQCRFIPLTVGSETFYAPNPIGNHNRVEGQILDGIKFINNYVEAGRPTADLTAGVAAYFHGWLHFFCARNVEVHSNTFVNTNNTFGTTVINARTPSTGTLMADVNNPSPVAATIPLVAPEGFRIWGNRYVGFKAPDNTDIVKVQGAATAKIKSLHWADRFEDCTPATGDTYSVTGQVGLNAHYVENLSIADTVINGLAMFVFLYKCGEVRLSNVGAKRITRQFGQFDDIDSVKFNAVDATYNGGVWMRNVRSVKFAATELKTFYSTTGSSIADSLVNLTGCKNLALDGATYSNASGNTWVKQAVKVSGTSQAGRVKDSIVIGTFANGPVVIDASSPTVTASGTLVGVI